MQGHISQFQFLEQTILSKVISILSFWWHLFGPQILFSKLRRASIWAKLNKCKRFNHSLTHLSEAGVRTSEYMNSHWLLLFSYGVKVCVLRCTQPFHLRKAQQCRCFYFIMFIYFKLGSIQKYFTVTILKHLYILFDLNRFDAQNWVIIL